MSLVLESADPRDPRAVALLSASHALMQELFPAESNHFLSIDALCADHIQFYVVRDGEAYLGCGAVAVYDDYAEVKSMFVDPAARGRGVADMVLAGLLEAARAAGMDDIKLETGPKLDAAHRLYEKHGFTYRGPFGDYPEDPNSLFMERRL